jgi:hypothetical protein
MCGSTYDVGKTISKGAVPVALVGLVELLAVLLPKIGIQVEKSVLYSVAVSGYGALMAFVNWLKNRKNK